MSNGGKHFVTMVVNGKLHDWQCYAAMNYTSIQSIVTQSLSVFQNEYKIDCEWAAKSPDFQSRATHSKTFLSPFSCPRTAKCRIIITLLCIHIHTHDVPFPVQCSQKHAIFMHWNEVNLHTHYGDKCGVEALALANLSLNSDVQKSIQDHRMKKSAYDIYTSRINAVHSQIVLASICFRFSAARQTQRHAHAIIHSEW